METNRSIESHTDTEIAVALEAFSTNLISYLSQKGLPKDNVLVPVDDRRPVLQNMPTVLNNLTDDQKSAAVYISKFTAACVMGLFDAALNYLWNETVRNLREKVARFDLEYFFDSVIDDQVRRSKLKGELDLEKLSDWELIRGCRTTGIITENGFRHLDYIRNMRNHASAAHPNQNEITGLQIIGWLETCIREVLAKEPAGPVIEVRKLLKSLREEQLSVDEVLPVQTGLSSLPDDLSRSLLHAVLGMYTDTDIRTQTKDNIKLVARSIWAAATDEARREAGFKHASLAVNGEAPRARLAREFIEIVDGTEFLTDETRAVEISTTLDNLMTAHHGWDNFFTEAAPARLLRRYVPENGDIPMAVLTKYVKTIVMCRIGNGYGVSWAAKGYYDDLLKIFSDDHIFQFINLVHDSEVSSRLQFPKCAAQYQKLAATMKTQVVKPRLKEMLIFMEEYPRDQQLSKIISDTRYRRLRNALQI